MTYEETLKMFLDNLNDEWEKGPYLFPRRFDMYIKEHERLEDGLGIGIIQVEIRNQDRELIIMQAVRIKSESFGTEMWNIYKEQLMRKIVNSLLGFGLIASEEQHKKMER